MKINIRKALEDNKINELEFISMLEGSSSSYNSENFVLSTDSHFIFEFYKYNHTMYPSKLKSVSIDEKHMSEKEFNKKIDETVSILKQSEYNVSSTIVFGYSESQLLFQYKNQFQVLRAPEDCPRPEIKWGGHYPILIRYKYKGHSNFRLDGNRLSQKRKELLLLLKIFIDESIFWYEDKSHKWVFTDEEPHVKFLQTGYYSLPSTIKAWNKKYENQLYSFKDIFGFEHDKRFPSYEKYTFLFDCFYNLDELEKEKTIKACYWFANAHNIHSISLSASYQSYINALESLLDKPKKTGFCDACKREEKESINKLFKNLITRYIKEDEKYLGFLYDIRSKITHGENIFENDLPNIYLGQSVKSYHEYDYIKGISNITKSVIKSWIIDNSSSRCT